MSDRRTSPEGIGATARRSASAAFHRLPAKWQDAVRAGRDALHESTTVEADDPHVTIPPDVADSDALATMLAQSDLFVSPAEAQGYLSDALKRFQAYSILPPSPEYAASWKRPHHAGLDGPVREEEIRPSLRHQPWRAGDCPWPMGDLIGGIRSPAEHAELPA